MPALHDRLWAITPRAECSPVARPGRSGSGSPDFRSEGLVLTPSGHGRPAGFGKRTVEQPRVGNRYCQPNQLSAITDIPIGSENPHMQITFTKGRDTDQIEARRQDGTVARTAFPKKGDFPHDAVHLIVEKRLRFQHGFWGRVASGANPGDIAAVATAGGHPSAMRPVKPAGEIIELLQAERLVECFEAEMWSVRTDMKTFRGILHAACSQSRIPTPPLSDEEVDDIRSELGRMRDAWRQLAVDGSMVLNW
jgi:hypothetical protein